jgi:hypothetical protein
VCNYGEWGGHPQKYVVPDLTGQGRRDPRQLAHNHVLPQMVGASPVVGEVHVKQISRQSLRGVRVESRSGDGEPISFAVSLVIVAVWAVSGPVFQYSERGG